MTRHRQARPRGRRPATAAIWAGGAVLAAVLVVGGMLLLSGHHRGQSTAGRLVSNPSSAASASATSSASSPARTSRGATPAPSPSAGSALPTPSTAPSDCGGDPHLCGYPDATNTGVPAGMALRSVPGQVSRGPGWHYAGGYVEVSGNGAVLQGLSIPYTVDVTGSGVTIKDVRITATGNSFGVSLRHTRNVTVEDSDISSPYSDSRRLMVGVKDIYGDATGTQVLGNNIWHTATGVQIGAGLIADNYIHDVGYASGDHVNGITVNGGTTPLTVKHNTVFVNFPQTDAISLFEDFGVEANKLIEDNLVAGGSYTIYGGQNSGGPQTYNIQIIDNRFARLYYHNSGQFGPGAAFNPKGRGNVWSGNVWDNTTSPISDPG